MRMLHVTALCLCLAATVEAQSYGGVVPGSDVLPENIPAAPESAALVTWPGFQLVPGGGSRVFLQTTVEVTPELKRDGDNWQVVLPGFALPPGNARRPLDTQYFNTPVRGIRTSSRGNAVVVTLHMRAKVQPIVRTERVQSGYYFTYLEFPPGNFI